MSSESEVIFMTYDDAAKRLGIKSDSVRRRAAARKWQKKIGNDGLARVGVPIFIIPDTPPAPIRAAIPDVSDDVRVELASVKAEMIGLRDRLADTQAERDRLSALLDRALEPRPVVQRGILDRIFGR